MHREDIYGGEIDSYGLVMFMSFSIHCFTVQIYIDIVSYITFYAYSVYVLKTLDATLNAISGIVLPFIHFAIL